MKATWSNDLIWIASKQVSVINKLRSQQDELDTFLDGGLAFGKVTEMGLPPGYESRDILVRFLSTATCQHQLLSLWVHCHPDTSLYPPAFFARGISPARMVFCTSSDPLRQLKRALISPLFKVIVIDSPAKLSTEECRFLNAQAQSYNQVIVIARPFFLTNKVGNIWAHLRFNIKLHATNDCYDIHILKGSHKTRLSLKRQDLYRSDLNVPARPIL